MTVSTARSLNDRFPVRSSSFRDGALGMKLMDLVELPADPLDSRRPAHVGVKKGFPSKKWLFILCWLV